MLHSECSLSKKIWKVMNLIRNFVAKSFAKLGESRGC